MATVKVRIAVAVDPTGKWYAIGYPDQDPKDAHEVDVDIVGYGEARYWVEAELPIPEETTVAASSVESANTVPTRSER